jgi:3-isopropylmalate dehydrogenase
MMLRFSFGWSAEADAIDSAVNAALAHGYRTADIFGDSGQRVSTREMSRAIIERIR